MTSSNENKPDVFEVFNRWAADVRKDKLSQYKYGERKAHVQNLIGYLKQYDIDKDDAVMLKRKVVEVLVHEKGMAGKDKYKGWKENVETDFEDAISIAYTPGLEKTNFQPLRNAQGYDPRIVKWAKQKFGDQIGEDIVQAAHQPMHALWMMFMNDHYNRDTGGIL